MVRHFIPGTFQIAFHAPTPKMGAFPITKQGSAPWHKGLQTMTRKTAIGRGAVRPMPIVVTTT